MGFSISSKRSKVINIVELMEMSNMRKLSVKLILSFAAFLTANLWLIGKGSAKGAADFLVSPAVEETILFILLQIIVILIYYIRPLTIRKTRIIYWLISEAFVAITFFFWGIFIVGPIWFQ